MSNEPKNTMPEKWVNLEDIAVHLSLSEDTVRASLTVEYIDQQTKATQVSQFDLVLEKNGSNWKIIE